MVAREWRDQSLGMNDSGGRKDKEEQITHEGRVRGRRRVHTNNNDGKNALKKETYEGGDEWQFR